MDVIYGNRLPNSVMFLDELEGLKDRYPDRLQLVHVLSREGSICRCSPGGSTRPSSETLLDRLLDAATSTSGSCAARTRW